MIFIHFFNQNDSWLESCIQIGKSISLNFHLNNHELKTMKTLPCLKSILAISLFLGLSSLSFAQNNESAVPAEPTTSQAEETDAALTSPPRRKHLRFILAIRLG